MSNQIYVAMVNILKEIKVIGKNRKADMGSAGKYDFRGIDDMYNTLHDLFAKHEVFIIPKVIDNKFEIQEKEKTYNNATTKSLQYSIITTVEYTFCAIDGSTITATGIGHALDNSDKGTNKAQSSALKYCLMQTFLIPTIENKDVENENNEVGKKANKSETPAPNAITPKKETVKTLSLEKKDGLIVFLSKDLEGGKKYFNQFLDLEVANKLIIPQEYKIEIQTKISQLEFALESVLENVPTPA